MELAQETAAGLSVKIASYKEQLAQVKVLADSEPGNQSYAKLVSDLEQLVQLTTDLV